MLNTINRARITAGRMLDDPMKESEMKNNVISDIMTGNRPLQGIKLFVRIAIILSLGVSIILQPITPAALQPKPIHVVNACFPQVEHF